MPIYYDLYQSPPQEGEKEGKQYARVKSIKTLSTKELVERTIQGSNISKAMANLVLDRAVEELKIALAQGYRVHIEELGYFSPQLTTILPTDHRKQYPKVRATGVLLTPEKDVKRYFMSIKTLRSVGINRAIHGIDKEAIDDVLRTHFETGQTITCSQLHHLYPTISRTSLCNYLKSCLEEEKLRNVGTKNAPVYMKGDKL